jgi:hypothetical protein
LQSFDDNHSETSESSIEVVSMDTTDLLSMESIQTPTLPSVASGPFLVLRLRSKEKGRLQFNYFSQYVTISYIVMIVIDWNLGIVYTHTHPPIRD